MIGRYEGLTAEELIEEIELLKWCNGVEYFKVVCSMGNEIRCVNIVRGIVVESEGGILYFDDEDNVLLTNNQMGGLCNMGELEIIKLSTYNFSINYKGSSINVIGLSENN